MSAIAGLYNLNNEEPVAIEQRNGMMKALEKFPADDIQVWQKGPVFLGCHAQWITPESIGEQLPFYDSERKCAITADCIIDNREELFEALQVPREDHKTIPDSLLILLAYYKWGEDCPKHLIGDFAFMIWDERERKMFGARDASGYRTLYYFKNEKSFGFCTTIVPILTLPFLKKQVNEEWIAEFLAITGLIDTADANITPYLNIFQIPPFHSLTVTDKKLKLLKYGTFYSKKKLKLKSDKEYVEAFQDLFQKAVNARLRTNRQVGSHLSGGLDSGAVVSFAVRELKKTNKPLHTFSYIPPKDFIDFTNKRLMPDERPFIKKTVDYVGGIKDQYCDFEGKSSYSELEEILEVNEMPYKFFENSFWLKGMFEEAQGLDCGILLNGDVGNLTVSWGSPFDYYAFLFKHLRLIRLTQELSQYSKRVGGDRFQNLPIIIKKAFLDKDYNSIRFPKIINSDFARRTNVYRKLANYEIDESGWLSTSNLFEQRRITFDKIYPYNSAHTLYTKLSLKYKVWKRDPTNDLRVTRFCLAVPEGQCVMNGLDRALIRRSTKDLLPDEIRLNQTIKGVQGADWIHRMLPDWDQFTKEIKDLLEEKKISKFVDDQVIRDSLSHVQNQPKPSHFTKFDYRMLTRSLILHRFIKKFY